MLYGLDESIKALTTKRESTLASYRASLLSDILLQDAAWLAEAKASPRDWARLLNTKTDNKEWREQVALEGVTGMSQWAYSDERAVTFSFYTELPKRSALYAWLIEEMMPFIAPWSRTDSKDVQCKFVSIYNRGHNLLLGKMPQGTWALSGRAVQGDRVYADLQSALNEAHTISARSHFCDDS